MSFGDWMPLLGVLLLTLGAFGVARRDGRNRLLSIAVVMQGGLLIWAAGDNDFIATTAIVLSLTVSGAALGIGATISDIPATPPDSKNSGQP